MISNCSIHDVSSCFQHECYRADGACGDLPYNDYDLAILELQDAADLNNHVTNTACLPLNASLDEFVDDVCYATGFGDTKGEGHILIVYLPNTRKRVHVHCI